MIHRYSVLAISVLAFQASTAFLNAADQADPVFTECVKRYLHQLDDIQSMKFSQENFTFNQTSGKYDKPLGRELWVIKKEFKDKDKKVVSVKWRRDEYINQNGKMGLYSIESGFDDKVSIFLQGDSILYLYSPAAEKSSGKGAATSSIVTERTQTPLPILAEPLETLLSDTRTTENGSRLRFHQLLSAPPSDKQVDDKLAKIVVDAGIYQMPPPGTGYLPEWLGHKRWRYTFHAPEAANPKEYFAFTKYVSFSRADEPFPIIARIMGGRGSDYCYERIESKSRKGKTFILVTGIYANIEEFKSRIRDLAIDGSITDEELTIDPTIAKRIIDQSTGMVVEP